MTTFNAHINMAVHWFRVRIESGAINSLTFITLKSFWIFNGHRNIITESFPLSNFQCLSADFAQTLRNDVKWSYQKIWKLVLNDDLDLDLFLILSNVSCSVVYENHPQIISRHTLYPDAWFGVATNILPEKLLLVLASRCRWSCTFDGFGKQSPDSLALLNFVNYKPHTWRPCFLFSL